MSLFISSLNYGSNGNCYYVANVHDSVLVDSVISCKVIEKRMKERDCRCKTQSDLCFPWARRSHLRHSYIGEEISTARHITLKTFLAGGLQCTRICPFIQSPRTHFSWRLTGNCFSKITTQQIRTALLFHHAD